MYTVLDITPGSSFLVKEKILHLTWKILHATRILGE